MTKPPISKSYGFDLLGCQKDLNDPALICEMANGFCDAFGFVAIGESQHAYPDHGLTHVTLLSQSHLVLSTWPEFEALQVDLGICGDQPDPQAMRDWLMQRMAAEVCEMTEFVRALRV